MHLLTYIINILESVPGFMEIAIDRTFAKVITLLEFVCLVGYLIVPQENLPYFCMPTLKI